MQAPPRDRMIRQANTREILGRDPSFHKLAEGEGKPGHGHD